MLLLLLRIDGSLWCGPRDAAPPYVDTPHLCFPARERKRSWDAGKRQVGEQQRLWWHSVFSASAENVKRSGFGEKLVACLILPFLNERSVNYSMRRQPQRAGKKRAVSHFSGNDHLTGRQKDPRVHRAECLMSVFTVSLPCLTLSAIQPGVTEYQPAIC